MSKNKAVEAKVREIIQLARKGHFPDYIEQQFRLSRFARKIVAKTSWAVLLP